MLAGFQLLWITVNLLFGLLASGLAFLRFPFFSRLSVVSVVFLLSVVVGCRSVVFTYYYIGA